MPVSISSLQKLSAIGLSSEQMAAVVEVLAVELAPLEAMRMSAAERQRRKRHVTVTPNPSRDSHGTVTVHPSRVDDILSNTLEVDRPVNNNPPVPPSKPEPDQFETFWAVYPKRSGTADRKGAVKAFNAAVKRADVETIVLAARAYAADMAARGKTGTEFVKQARSWLNGDLWTEYQPKETTARPSGHYIQYGTEAGDAWERHYRTRGKVPPRDNKGGWYFPAEFPDASEQFHERERKAG